MTQGAISLKDQAWGNGKLALRVEAIGGFAQTLRFFVPQGFAFSSATVDGVCAPASAQGSVVSVTVESEKTAVVTVELSFVGKN